MLFGILDLGYLKVISSNGCFNSISDLNKVPGITQADVDAITAVAEVGSCPRDGAAPAKAQT